MSDEDSGEEMSELQWIEKCYRDLQKHDSQKLELIRHVMASFASLKLEHGLENIAYC